MNYDELKQKVRSYRQQNDEQPQSGKRKKTYDELKEEVRQKRFQEDVSKVDQDYLDNFTKSANDFFSSTQVDIGWDNAGSLYQDSQKKLKDLDYRRSVISSWLASNKDLLDPESYKSLSESMSLFSSDTNKVMSYLSEANDYFDKDKNQDAYLAYVDHQNKMDYDLTAGQKKIDDLTRLLELSSSDKKDSYSDPSANRHTRREMQNLMSKYGLTSDDNINEILAAERVMFRESSWAQKEAELSSVANEPDFEEYSQKGAELQNPSYKDANGWAYVFGWRPGADEVKNKVTFARDNADTLLLEKYSGDGNASTPYIVDPIYRLMYEDEVAIYSYYLAKYGEEKADEYLKSLKGKLNQREAAEEFGRIEGNTALELMYGVTVGVDQFRSGMMSLGESIWGDSDYIEPSYIQYAGQMVREDLADNGPEVLGSSLAQVGYDALTTTANMAPSILASYAVGMLNPTAGKVVGSALLGASAAGNAYQQKLNEGYSKEQARTYGLMVGASESIMEVLIGGISKLGGGVLSKTVLKNLSKLDNVLGKVAQSAVGKVFMNATSEAIEEGLQSILEPHLWQIVSGADYSVESQEVLYSALLGFITGGVFEGANASFETVARDVGTKQQYGAMQGDITATALELNPDSKFAQRMQSRLDNGKNLSGSQLNRLLKQIGSDITADGSATVREESETIGAEENSQHSGLDSMTDEHQEIANEIAKALSESDGDIDFAKEYSDLFGDPESETMSEPATVDVVDPGAVDFEESYRALFDDAEADLAEANTSVEITEDSDASDVDPLPTGEISDADSTISEGVQESSTAPDTSVSLEQASRKYGAQAKAMMATYNQGQDVARFDRAYKIAYDMGQVSPAMMRYALNSEATSYLTPEQIRHAVNAGMAATDARDSAIERENKAKGKVTTRRKEGTVKVEGEASEFREALKDPKDPRRNAIKTLMAIAKATGVNIVLTMSKVDSKGRFVGDQGQYRWSDDTIFIDINSGLKYESDIGEISKYAMLRTFGHEFTHFLEKNSPKQYSEFRDFVFSMMTARGENVDHLIRKKQTEYENISYEAASREVVAESMTDILRDSKYIAQLEQQNMSLFQKLLSKLKEFAASIKSQFAALAPNPSLEAKALQDEIGDTMKYLDSIIEKFDKLAADAVANYQGIGSETTVAEVSEQIDSDIADAMGPDGIALQTPDGSVAVVAKPSENGIESVIVDSGAWDTQKSIRTYKEDILTDEDGNTISGKDLFRNLMKENGFSDTDIDSAVKRMDSIIDVLTNDFAAFGKLQDNLQKGITTNILNPRQRVLFAMISNGDYPVNGELSTTCVNRQAFQNMFEKLVESGIMKDVVFNSAAIAEMNAILRDHGYLTACFSCFVEARRVRVQKWAENFVSKWNEVAMKRGAKEQFGFFKNRENPEAMTKGDIFDIEEQLSQVDKNDQGNVALPKGNVTKKINVLLDKVPSLTKLLTVEDIMSVGGLNAMRRFGEGGQNVFALLKSSYGTASPKISQDFEAYGGDFAKMSFEYIKDTLGKSIPGAQDLVRKIATQKTEATFEGKSYTKKAYSEEYSKNLNSASTKREALREYLYSIAGIRYQSFSDFDITQVFDKMQVFNDIAANRAPLHEYTKVISDIRIFGMTGGKMNASVIHQVDPSLGKENAGLVRLENGQLGYVADDRRHYEQSGKKNPHRAPQSIDYMDAVALMLDPRYSPNMGTIAIGFSNKHIEMMLDDNNIRMVIPYHRSGLPTLYMHLTGLSAINADGKTELIVEDYTDTQTASVKELYNSKGKPVNQNSLTKANRKKLREAAMEWKFAEHLNKNNGDPRKTAKEYLEWCASDHVFVTKDGKEFHFTVKPAFDQFSKHDNYYKVLIDFDPYDPVTGEIAKQGPVRISYAGDSEATTLNEQQLAEYRERLEATNMYTAEQIDGYMQWAQQDLLDIIREEMGKEQKYIESTDAQAGPAFEKVSEMLRTKYNRATYNENAVMAEYGIAAEQKSKETSYRQDTVLHESDFDQQNIAEENIDSEDENRVQYQKRNYSEDYESLALADIRDVVKSGAGIKWNNGNVLKLPRSEYAAVVSRISTEYYRRENRGGVQFIERSTDGPNAKFYLYLYMDHGFDNYEIICRLEYSKQDELIHFLRKEIQNGRQTEGVSPSSDELRSLYGDTDSGRDDYQDRGFQKTDDQNDSGSRRSGRGIERWTNQEGLTGDNEESDIVQSQKRTNTLTDHEILDMAAKELDTSKLTDGEKAALEIFRKKNDALKALKEERKKQGSLYYQYQFGDQKDAKKATEARNRMTVLDGKITKASAEVLGIEDKKVLKDVLQKSRKVIEQHERKASIERVKAAREEARVKERKIANEKLEALRQKKNERIAEVRAEERQKAQEKAENRKKTELRTKIQKQLSELNSLLQNGNKKKNVKNGMKDTASALLAYGELLFSDDANLTPEAMVRNGIGTDLTEAESKLLNEYNDLLEKRDLYLGQIDEAASGTDANKDARIEGLQKMVDIINQKKLPALIKKLDGVFERERARLNKVTFSAVLKDLTDSYKALEKSKDPYVSGAYNQYVYDRLVAMNNPDAGVATTIKDMSLTQLAELNDAIKMVVTSIKNANTLFRDGQREALSERAEQVFMEIRKLYRKGGDPTAFKHAMTDMIKSFAWDELKPIYAFERIGSEKFTELFWDVINGESEYGLECEKAADFVRELRESSGYKKWDFDKVKVFKTVDGQDFKLTLGDMMSIYAYSRRDQAHKHMFEGGFTFHTGKTETYKDTDGKKRVRLVAEDTYRMTPELLDEILSSLSKEQKAYAEAMQDYLTQLGEMGNKVSRVLYGIDLFKETHYFPLKSDRDYRSTVEAQLNQTQTAASLVNIGMAKETVPEASNPIVLQRFDDVAVQHIDQMLKYSSMVLPIENLRKVMDFAPGEYGTWNAPVKKLISTVHGVSASQYVNQWITDLNGSSGLDGAKNPLSSMFARSKKVAVAGNLSVVVQQYFAVARALSEIDGKYFFDSNGKADGSQWEELKKWAGVAVIKDIGGFDMGSARSATEYIGKAGAKTSIGDKIDKVASYGSAKMDELGWGTIWRAAKAEIADTTNLKVGSDEFFKAAAKRFTEVVVKTQVYDSVTSRSGFMRSKSEAVKYLVSFMGEPTTTVNMMLDAQMKLFRSQKYGTKADVKKAGAYMARTSGAVILSTVLGIIAKSAVYAMRDDDDDTESFMERYMKQIGSSFHQELNPLNLLPVARDIMSMIKGRDIERPDMALINSTIKAFKKALKADENQLEAWGDVVLSVINMLGVPLKNVLRDGAGVVRLIGDITDDISPKDLGKAFLKEGFLGRQDTKNETLYAAIVTEDAGRLEVLRKGYKSDTDYTNAVRKALRECDDRIHLAAEARYSGDIETYTELAKEIIAEGHFIQDDVVAAIMAEITAMENETKGDEESSPKVYSMYTPSDYLLSVDQPKLSKEIKDYLIAEYIEKGKTNAEAQAEFKSDVKDQVKIWYTDEESEVRITKQQATEMLRKYVGMNADDVTSTINQWSSKVVTGIAYDDIKDEFMSGSMTASRAIDMRVRYGGMSKEDATAEVSAWNAEKKYGLAPDLAKAYTKPIEPIGKSLEQAGIKADVFTKYKDLSSKCEGYDKNGDGKADSGSVKEQIMDVIHSLPLTVAQKDALYYSNSTWSVKTINEAPWRKGH